jgi:flagellar biosynthesis protein FliP
MNEQISSNEAMDRAVEPIRNFMLRQTRPGEVDFFSTSLAWVARM